MVDYYVYEFHIARGIDMYLDFRTITHCVVVIVRSGDNIQLLLTAATSF